MIVIMKKFLISIINLLNLSINSISLLSSIIIIIYTACFTKAKPFLNPMLNILEYSACIFLICAIFINTLINQIDSKNLQIKEILLILNIMLFLLNLGFFMFWSWHYIGYLFYKYTNILKEKFPFIYRKLRTVFIYFDVKILNVIKANFSSKKINFQLPKINVFVTPKAKFLKKTKKGDKTYILKTKK